MDNLGCSPHIPWSRICDSVGHQCQRCRGSNQSGNVTFAAVIRSHSPCKGHAVTSVGLASVGLGFSPIIALNSSTVISENGVLPAVHDEPFGVVKLDEVLAEEAGAGRLGL
eukprot:SAG11_NODE_19375_length_468_cov_0.691057_1_plen_110_part_01